MSMKASTLLRGLKRSAPGKIPPYQEDIVREIREDITAQGRDMYLAVGASSGEFLDSASLATTVIQELSIRHCKRCLLAYHSARIDNLEEYLWTRGPVLNEELRSCLCGEEIDYFKDYTNAVDAFIEKSGFNVLSYTYPPKYDMVTVRAIKDCGEVMTSKGPRTLQRGDINVMTRNDSENLIKQGLVEIIS